MDQICLINSNEPTSFGKDGLDCRNCLQRLTTPLLKHNINFCLLALCSTGTKLHLRKQLSGPVYVTLPFVNNRGPVTTAPFGLPEPLFRSATITIFTIQQALHRVHEMHCIFIQSLLNFSLFITLCEGREVCLDGTFQ